MSQLQACWYPELKMPSGFSLLLPHSRTGVPTEPADVLGGCLVATTQGLQRLWRRSGGSRRQQQCPGCRREARKDVGEVATSRDKKVLRVILFIDFLTMLTMYNYKFFVRSTLWCVCTSFLKVFHISTSTSCEQLLYSSQSL